MDAYNELLNKLKILETKINAQDNTIKNINGTINILVRKSDLENSFQRLKGDISNISSVVTILDNKLKKVLLPNETKYYLDETELTNIRNKIRQMNALMISLQNLEKTIISTLSRLDSKFSTVSSIS